MDQADRLADASGDDDDQEDARPQDLYEAFVAHGDLNAFASL